MAMAILGITSAHCPEKDANSLSSTNKQKSGVSHGWTNLDLKPRQYPK